MVAPDEVWGIKIDSLCAPRTTVGQGIKYHGAKGRYYDQDKS